MKKSETAEIMARIISMYPSFKIGGEIGGVEIKNPIRYWHEQIGYMDFAKAEQAVKECINVCRYAPTAAEIIEAYNKIEADESKAIAEINRFYEQSRSYYPGSGDIGYGKAEFTERAKTPEQAERLYKAIVRYVNNCEKETMDFAECVRTIK